MDIATLDPAILGLCLAIVVMAWLITAAWSRRSERHSEALFRVHEKQSDANATLKEVSDHSLELGRHQKVMHGLLSTQGDLGRLSYMKLSDHDMHLEKILAGLKALDERALRAGIRIDLLMPTRATTDARRMRRWRKSWQRLLSADTTSLRRRPRR